MIIEKLRDLELEGKIRGIPILGGLKGAWLYNKVLESKPKNILELGTANGYSGCILGSLGAKLTTIEIDKNTIEEAKINFAGFGISAEIIFGDAVDEVKKLVLENKLYDIIFIDFMKSKYLSVMEDCIKLVKINGFIIADNITFQGCINYREAVLHHPKLKTKIIDIADGLSCSVRIN